MTDLDERRPQNRPRNTAQTLWSRTEADGECRVWAGVRSFDGYGQMRYQGRMWRTHRLAWELTIGPIPPGLHVLHNCDNPPCINVAHLRLGTNADNTADRVKRGRHTPARGERQGSAKLTAARVLEARERHARGATFSSLAREFSVNESTVARAVRGYRWRHV